MLTAYYSLGVPQDEPFKDKRLIPARDASRRSKYELVTYREGIPVKYSTPHGLYDFVIPLFDREIVYILKNFLSDVPPNKHGRPMPTSARGHSSIAQGRPVLYAGEIHFMYGRIESWNNKSGHYQIGSKIASKDARRAHCLSQAGILMQDGGPLLPPEKFVLWNGID